MDDRLELPADVELVRTTRVFDQDTVPAGLLDAHRIAEGVWGRLLVSSGAVGFSFEDESILPRQVAAGDHQVIPPSRPHRLTLRGPATFVIEFHSSPSPSGADD